MKQNRRNWLIKTTLAVVATTFTKLKSLASFTTSVTQEKDEMKLGAFSISLAVKDLAASRQFYEALGFTLSNGDLSKNYLIMKNENAVIGLFHGMFEKNILTFNPGWDENAKSIENFTDVRSLQKQLKSKGIKLASEADEKISGPAYFTLNDPDGNQVLVDQHV